MLRLTAATVAATALLALALPALAGDAHTTRIEPRPFYGATVTLEEGVRVFRVLPVQRHVIINPDNKTQLNLSYYEERSASRSYDSGPGPSGGADYGYADNGLGGYSYAPAYGIIGTQPTFTNKGDRVGGVFGGPERLRHHGPKFLKPRHKPHPHHGHH